MIFHIPMRLNSEHASASQIRPRKLIQAFQSIGYQVDVVEGPGSERKKRINEIKQKIRGGEKYDFLYSESSVMPTLLTESHHFPTYPALDFSFFSFCKKNNIPIGLFYRDIHWRFINKNRGWKQRVAKYFYRYDLRKYVQLLDVLFLPTLRMLPNIPFDFPRQVVELPAGCDMAAHEAHSFETPLRLLYIGGIGGNYDLKTFLEAVKVTPSVHLTLCCRPSDWEKVSSDYQAFVDVPNIKITHQQGEALVDLYRQADLFALLFATTPYIQFAAPYKLFEAMGYHKPLIGYKDSWCGQFVEKQGIGLACEESVEDIVRCFNLLQQDESLLQNCQKQLQNIAEQHTWEARCRQIINALTSM